MRVDAKIEARQWILNAIQNHSCVPSRRTEREIRKYVQRLQGDLRHMERSRELYVLVNSADPEAKQKAMSLISEDLPPKGQQRKIELRSRQKELSALIKKQKKDANDRRIRFEHAVAKR